MVSQLRYIAFKIFDFDPDVNGNEFSVLDVTGTGSYIVKF